MTAGEPVDCLARGTWGHLSDERKCAEWGSSAEAFGTAPRSSVVRPHHRFLDDGQTFWRTAVLHASAPVARPHCRFSTTAKLLQLR